MIDLITKIIQALVDNPEQIQISIVEGKQTSIIEAKVAKEDLGKIIGKQGRTAQAIRTLVSAASGKKDKRFTFEIIE